MTSRSRDNYHGEGVKDFGRTVQASVMKSVTMRERGLKNVQSCVTSFMDDPFSNNVIGNNMKMNRKFPFKTFSSKVHHNLLSVMPFIGLVSWCLFLRLQ
jgi:hypothetical protein